MMSDDMRLLREYAESNSESSFSALVSRHVNLVYSVALRQTRDPHLAEEITQGVFIILARKAKLLSADTILSGWLCRTARYVASDTLKLQRRRQIREQEALMQPISSESSADAWQQIAPVLDEGLNGLRQQEHDAIVLRYFEGKDFKEVGVAMGMKEDAARMRVNRGLEKLRKFFGRKGVTLSIAAITAAVAANSVQAAPAGLAAAIAAAALSGVSVTIATVITATKVVAMTILQKISVALTVTVLVGVGVYEARQVAQLRKQVQTFGQQQAPLMAQIQELRRERDDATNRLASLAVEQSSDAELLKLRSEVTRLHLESQELAKLKAEPAVKETKTLADETESLMDRVTLLKERLNQTPDAKIPELQFLTEEDWLRVAAAPAKLIVDDDFQKAFSDLRSRGEGRFLDTMETALRKYMEAGDNQFPTELSQLRSYFKEVPADDILQRYQIVPAGSLPAASALSDTGDWIITLKSPLDGGLALGTNGVAHFVNDSAMDILAPAMRAMAEDTPPSVDGRKAMRMDQLGPYLKTPEQKAAYEKLMQKNNSAPE